MKLIVAVEDKKIKTVKYKKEDLLTNTVMDLLEEKGIKNVLPEDIEIEKDKIIVKTGNIKTIEVDEKELLTKSLTAIVKDKLKIRSVKGLSISIKSCEGK